MKLRKHKMLTLIPFIMIIISGMSGYFSSYDFYKSIFPYLGDLVGYSILTNLVFMFLYFREKFCLQTKICVLGLLAMNAISLIFVGTDYYNPIYDLWIGIIVLILVVLSFFKWRL